MLRLLILGFAEDRNLVDLSPYCTDDITVPSEREREREREGRREKEGGRSVVFTEMLSLNVRLVVDTYN